MWVLTFFINLYVESNVSIRLAKVWRAINRLSIIQKSDLSEKNK